MVDVNTLMAELKPFRNEREILVNDQDTGDIIQNLLEKHEQQKQEYDKIYEFFEGDNEIDTARNTFNFLKRNVKYQVEPDQKQILKTPSAILATGKITGSDCKNYALFCAGVMDAYRRNVDIDYDLSFRFASYDFSTIPQHVFVVLTDSEDNELWIDPVLNGFDERKRPSFYRDRKIKNMPLIALSGTSSDQFGNYGRTDLYATGPAQYGNHSTASSSRYKAPSSRVPGGIGAVDYTPYLIVGAVAIGLYFLLRK
jgi:hypothetical protein